VRSVSFVMLASRTGSSVPQMQLVKNNKLTYVKVPGDPHCVLSLDVKTFVLIWSSSRTSLAIYISFSVYTT